MRQVRHCRWLSLSLVAAAAPAFPTLAQDVSLNEIRVDELGVDLNEYVELAGPAGTSVAGLWYIVIGDDDFQFPPLQNGSIEVAVPLKGVIPGSGYFVLAESTYTLGVADQYGSFNLESPDNTTHLLVSGFTGAVGDDLDTNDDGVLDITPWTALLDGVCFIENQNPDGITSDFYYYEPQLVGPSGSGSPMAAFRCEADDEWKPLGDDPAGDTPGAPNTECAGGSAFQLAEVRVDQSGADNDEYVEITGPAGASLAGIFVITLGDFTPADGSAADLQGRVESVADLSLASIQADGRCLVAESTFTLGVADYTVVGNELNFENSDNVTVLLVRGFTGTLDQDLDLNDDGVLDLQPWIELLDSVAVVGSDTTFVYAPSVGPDGVYVPGHVSRCESNEWKIGAFDATAGGDTPGEANLPCSAFPILECGQEEAGACDVVHANPYCSTQSCCTAVCATDPACCSVGWDQACVDSALANCAPGTATCEHGAIAFNEIRIDHTGTDTDEYVEIRGAAGTDLTGYSIIVIGDGTVAQASGVLEVAFSLSGAVIPEDGSLLVGNTGMLLGTPDVSSGVASNWFENSDNITFFLVSGFSGTVGSDLDTNDDGTLDLIPWSEAYDHVAFIESNATPPVGTEYAYSANRVGPDGTFVPGQIWRCQDTGCWNIGLFDTAGGSDSPGGANPDCAPPTCPADVNGDGQVSAADLTLLLGTWGEAEIVGDINGDGIVSAADLTILLGAWGPCP